MSVPVRAWLGALPLCLLPCSAQLSFAQPLVAPSDVGRKPAPGHAREAGHAADLAEGEPAPVAGPSAADDPLLESEAIYEAVAEVEAPPRQATERSVPREQLTRIAGTSGDPLRAVEILPGVARSPDGEPILRGAAQHESAVFIDGTAVPYLYHFGGLRSVIHPRLVERVDVYPGNFSPRYGRASGGIVEARLRDPRSDGLHGEIELSLLDAGALVEGPLGEHVSFAAAARRSNVDLVFDALVPQDTFDVVVAPLYWDYQAALLASPGAGRWRFTAFGARDETTLLFSEPSADNVALRGSVGGSLEFHRSLLSYDDQFGEVSQRLMLSFGTEHVAQQLGPNTQAYFDAVALAARGEWQIPLSGSISLLAGVDLEVTWFEGAYRGPAARALEGSLDTPDNIQDQINVARTSFTLASPALYLEAHYFPTSKLALLLGIRADHYQSLAAYTLNPRLSQRFAASDIVTLKSAVGLYSQPPEYYESIEGVGNPEIAPYHAWHASAGTELALSDALSLDVEGFFKRSFNRVVSAPGGAPPHFVNDGSGRVVGLEAGARYHASSGVSAQLAYTLSRSERRDRDEPWRLFDSDQPHVLSVALGAPLGAGFHAGVRFRYVSGNPMTPVIGSVYDAGTDLYYPLYGAQNAARDPTFHQLDLRLEKRFQLGSGALSVYLDVQNVYAAENPEGFTYSYDYREREPASGSPFFPNLGLRGEL